jgi:hypothetical protein
MPMVRVGCAVYSAFIYCIGIGRDHRILNDHDNKQIKTKCHPLLNKLSENRSSDQNKNGSQIWVPNSAWILNNQSCTLR